jgi:hypothetical protein
VFNELSEKSKSKPPAAKPIKPVINLSSPKIESNTINVLEKGLNHAITPSRIPVEDFICSLKSAVYKLDPVLADNVKKNITRDECTALLELRNLDTPLCVRNKDTVQTVDCTGERLGK